MKITALLLFICLSGLKLQAQNKTDTIDFRKHLGKIATLCDTVRGIKIVNDTLTYLYMGGNTPNQKFIAAIKGNRITLDWANITGKHLCITGVLELYKEKLEVVATEPDQIGN